MSFLFVEADLAAKLGQADDSLQLCTRDGRVLGYFSPAKAKTLRLEPPISQVELNRIAAEEGGRPLADILRDLEKRS